MERQPSARGSPAFDELWQPQQGSAVAATMLAELKAERSCGIELAESEGQDEMRNFEGTSRSRGLSPGWTCGQPFLGRRAGRVLVDYSVSPRKGDRR